MGAHFHLSNLRSINILDIITNLKTNGYNIIGATLDGLSYKNIKIKKKWALILGNEAHGISKDIIPLLDKKISIPQIGSIESLNVAVAGSILLDRLITD